MKRICKNCKWFIGYSSEHQPRGTCRRFPPTPLMGYSSAWFPEVAGDKCWCGEFKPKGKK